MSETFFNLRVPAGHDRRELYKSQYRAIYTYKMSAQELDALFQETVLKNKDTGVTEWNIKQGSDERVKCVGKLEVEQDATTLKVTFEDYPEAGMSALKYYTIQTFTK